MVTRDSSYYYIYMVFLGDVRFSFFFHFSLVTVFYFWLSYPLVMSLNDYRICLSRLFTFKFSDSIVSLREGVCRFEFLHCETIYAQVISLLCSWRAWLVGSIGTLFTHSMNLNNQCTRRSRFVHFILRTECS